MKIGSKISLKTFNNKIVPNSNEGELKEFEIIGKNKIGEVEYYIVLVPDNFIGWYVSKFHIEHQKIADKHFGAKFWEVSEFYDDIE